MDTNTLTIGDVLEAGPLMPVLSTEQVVLQVLETSKYTVTMEATYFGVHLGKLTVIKNKEAP